MTITASYWKDYYESISTSGQPWLDCSNERVHLQTVSIALGAAGSVLGKRCVELGCGRGHLSQCLSILGAGECVAVDQIESMINNNARTNSNTKWICSSVEPKYLSVLEGPFDLVFAVEVLQYLPVEESVRAMSTLLEKGGRLVVIVPNGECPIATRAAQHFEGHYVAPTWQELARAASTSDQGNRWSICGMSFRNNQSIAPYEISAWSQSPTWNTPPNRLAMILDKS